MFQSRAIAKDADPLEALRCMVNETAGGEGVSWDDLVESVDNRSAELHGCETDIDDLRSLVEDYFDEAVKLLEWANRP